MSSFTSVLDQLGPAVERHVTHTVFNAQAHTWIAPQVPLLDQAAGGVEHHYILTGEQGVPHDRELRRARGVDRAHNRKVRLLEKSTYLLRDQHVLFLSTLGGADPR